jgi:hypothetical protein
LGIKDIFKLTIGNKCLHEDSNDDCFRIVNFAKSTFPVDRSMMFPHQNIHKYTWTSPDGKTHNHIWSILNVGSFREADCDTDHYMVVAKLRERLAVSKEAACKFDVEIFHLRNWSLGNTFRQI